MLHRKKKTCVASENPKKNACLNIPVLDDVGSCWMVKNGSMSWAKDISLFTLRFPQGEPTLDIKLRTEYFEALEVLEVVEATDLVSAVSWDDFQSWEMIMFDSFNSLDLFF